MLNKYKKFTKGDLVYWENSSDSSYSGVYEVLGKSTKSSYIEIYNEKNGKVIVPKWDLTLYVNNVESIKESLASRIKKRMNHPDLMDNFHKAVSRDKSNNNN